jgi:hypothetical protein
MKLLLFGIAVATSNAAGWTRIAEGPSEYCLVEGFEDHETKNIYSTSCSGGTCTMAHVEKARDICASQCDEEISFPCVMYSIVISEDQLFCVGSPRMPTMTTTQQDEECWTNHDSPNNCKNWDCPSWCSLYDENFTSQYENAGCADDGEDCDCSSAGFFAGSVDHAYYQSSAGWLPKFDVTGTGWFLGGGANTDLDMFTFGEEGIATTGANSGKRSVMFRTIDHPIPIRVHGKWPLDEQGRQEIVPIFAHANRYISLGYLRPKIKIEGKGNTGVTSGGHIFAEINVGDWDSTEITYDVTITETAIFYTFTDGEKKACGSSDIPSVNPDFGNTLAGYLSWKHGDNHLSSSHVAIACQNTCGPITFNEGPIDGADVSDIRCEESTASPTSDVAGADECLVEEADVSDVNSAGDAVGADGGHAYHQSSAGWLAKYCVSRERWFIGGPPANRDLDMFTFNEDGIATTEANTGKSAVMFRSIDHPIPIRLYGKWPLDERGRQEIVPVYADPNRYISLGYLEDYSGHHARGAIITIGGKGNTGGPFHKFAEINVTEWKRTEITYDVTVTEEEILYTFADGEKELTGKCDIPSEHVDLGDTLTGYLFVPSWYTPPSVSFSHVAIKCQNTCGPITFNMV